MAVLAAPAAIEGGLKAYSTVVQSDLVQDQQPLLRKTLFGGVLGIAGYVGVSFIQSGGIAGNIRGGIQQTQAAFIDSTIGIFANIGGYKGSLGDNLTGISEAKNNETFFQKYGAAVAGITMFEIGFYYG